MKKTTVSILLVLIALVMTVTGALAAGAPVKSAPDPFDSIFVGTVTGDRGSEAPIQVNLSQRGKIIDGELILGEGLYVDGGRCWRGYLPEGVFSASGSPLTRDPNRVQASYAYKISGISITGYLNGVLSADGETLDAEVKIDIPWFCGSDPLLQVSADKQG